MSQLSKGVAAPDFELPSLEGDSRRLGEELNGGSVVLVFYKASCPTCEFVLPYIQRIHADAADGRRMKIWGISQDDVAETREFSERLDLSFELLVDEHPYPVSSAYGLEFVPAIFIVGKDRKIRLSDFGFTKSSLNAIAGFEFLKPDDGLPASRPG